MEYLGSVLGALLSPLMIVFVVLALGYLLGAITIKGVSLGSAGVLIVAIIVGVIFFLCGDKNELNKLIECSFVVGDTKITLWGSSPQSVFKTVQNIGTMLFVTSVGLIAGPKFFRSFNRSTISYVVMGAGIVLTGVAITVLLGALDPNMTMAMATGLLSGSLTSTPAFGAAEEAAGTLANEVTAGYGIGYLYGVLGVVLFVQLMPKILKVDIAKDDKVIEELGIHSGETTADGKFTIQDTRCLGCCGLAPVMTINEDVYGKLTPAMIKDILAKY